MLRQCDFSPIAFSLSSSLCCSNAPFAKKKDLTYPALPYFAWNFLRTPHGERREDIKWTSLRLLQRMKFEKTKKWERGVRTSKIGAWHGPPRARIWRKKCPLFLKRRLGKKIRASEKQKDSPQIKAAEKQLFFPKKTDLQNDERKLIIASFLKAKCKCGARLSKKRMLRTWEFFFGPRGKRTPKGEATTSFAPISPLSSFCLRAIGGVRRRERREA